MVDLVRPTNSFLKGIQDASATYDSEQTESKPSLMRSFFPVTQEDLLGVSSREQENPDSFGGVSGHSDTKENQFGDKRKKGEPEQFDLGMRSLFALMGSIAAPDYDTDDPKSLLMTENGTPLIMAIEVPSPLTNKQTTLLHVVYHDEKGYFIKPEGHARQDVNTIVERMIKDGAITGQAVESVPSFAYRDFDHQTDMLFRAQAYEKMLRQHTPYVQASTKTPAHDDDSALSNRFKETVEPSAGIITIEDPLDAPNPAADLDQLNHDGLR